MSQQTDDIQKMLDELSPETADDPIVITYADGTSDILISHREILERQLELHKFADEYVDRLMNGESFPIFDSDVLGSSW